MNHKYLGTIAAIFLKRHLKTSRQALFYGLISGLLLACPDSPATPTGTVNNCVDIINAGMIPPDFAGYDQASRDIFSAHTPGAALVAKYVKEGGTGDGSTYATAAGNVKAVLDGITDAAANKVYVVVVAPGTYDAVAEMAMKNNVAIVGGGTCLGTGGATTLSGGKTHRVFNNKDLNNTAILYGVTITDGRTTGSGSGMFNHNSSPTLTRVTFFTNWAGDDGAGMYNRYSSPLLTGVTFSKNWAEVNGGGMFNTASSPVLSSVTFSGNRGRAGGGGMYSFGGSPILIGVSFFIGNGAEGGGAMYHSASIDENNTSAGARLVNTILWGNVADGTNPGKEILLNRNKDTKIRLYLYNSILDRGIPAGYSSGDLVASLNDGYGIYASAVATATTTVSFANIITNDPGLNNTLANNGGGVLTHAIPASSSAVNQGLYVKRSAKPTGRECGNQCDRYTFYYSEDNSKWYTDPTLTTSSTPPADAVDMTATDATGYERTGKPDLGAYEAR